MFQLRQTVLSVLSVLCLSSTASAGILIEPYLGYGMGKSKFTSPSAYEGDISGTMLGARVAYTIPIFFFGLDYGMFTGQFKVTSHSVLDYDASASALYLLAGAQIPLIRGYIGYAIMGSSKTKDSSGETTSTGSSMKLGASFTGLPFVALNLEYIRDTYTKSKDASSEWSVSGASDIYLLSVSLPLDF